MSRFIGRPRDALMNPASNVAMLTRASGGLALLKTDAKLCGGE